MSPCPLVHFDTDREMLACDCLPMWIELEQKVNTNQSLSWHQLKSRWGLNSQCIQLLDYLQAKTTLMFPQLQMSRLDAPIQYFPL